MPYKTILVHAALDAGAGERVRAAARLARAAEAHLVGAAATGISRFLTPETIAAGGPAAVRRCATLRADAARALQQFERIMREEDVASAEARLVDDDIASALALQARYADLAIVGRCVHGRVHPPAPDDLPDSLVLATCRPVLALPPVAGAVSLDGLALVAWDGGVPAAHALDGALPLLCAAARVVVLRRGAPARREDGGGDAPLRCWFARHGIDAYVAHRAASAHVGRDILADAAEFDASLLVIGAYGHERWRETLFDGATAAVLRAAPLPVLLAH